MTWRNRDQYLNPLKSILCIIGIAIVAALMVTGIVGALWAVVEGLKAIGIG